MTMTKDEWKNKIAIDDDEYSCVQFELFSTNDENGNKIFKEGLDVHFNLSGETALSLIKPECIPEEFKDSNDIHADLYFTFFTKDHIDSLIVISKGEFEKPFREGNGKTNIPDAIKEAALDLVEDYHDMELDKAIKWWADTVERGR